MLDTAKQVPPLKEQISLQLSQQFLALLAVCQFLVQRFQRALVRIRHKALEQLQTQHLVDVLEDYGKVKLSQ